MARRLLSLVLVLVLAACRGREPAPSPIDAAAAPETRADAAAPLAPLAPRTTMTGAAFPDGVLALTWDDGPDVHTVELARYLRSERVSATFFVVHAWADGVSEEPGKGKDPFATGAAHLPVLADLVALGHRVANHTENHVLLTEAPEAEAARQLRAAAARLEPFAPPGQRFFRPPGGAWSARASLALERAHALDGLVGPVGWDVDGKDWEGSLYCRSDHPDTECEPGPIPGERRVRAEVVAARYLARVESARHGIVLLHDRVGHVGSRYALDVAARLVPALRARGYVFAAPVLAFGPPLVRSDVSAAAGPDAGARGAAPSDVGDPIGLADLNGDGTPDACGLVPEGVACALASPKGFLRATVWAPGPALPGAGRPWLVDVNGDRRADLCASRGSAVVCALAP